MTGIFDQENQVGVALFFISISAYELMRSILVDHSGFEAIDSRYFNYDNVSAHWTHNACGVLAKLVVGIIYYAAFFHDL